MASYCDPSLQRFNARFILFKSHTRKAINGDNITVHWKLNMQYANENITDRRLHVYCRCLRCCTDGRCLNWTEELVRDISWIYSLPSQWHFTSPQQWKYRIMHYLLAVSRIILRVLKICLESPVTLQNLLGTGTGMYWARATNCPWTVMDHPGPAWTDCFQRGINLDCTSFHWWALFFACDAYCSKRKRLID